MKRSQGRRQLARGNILPFNFAPFVRFDIYRRAACSTYEVQIRKEIWRFWENFTSFKNCDLKMFNFAELNNRKIQDFRISLKKVKIQIRLNIGNTNIGKDLKMIWNSKSSYDLSGWKRSIIQVLEFFPEQLGKIQILMLEIQIRRESRWKRFYKVSNRIEFEIAPCEKIT